MVDYRFFSILGRKSYYPPKDGMLTLLCRNGDSSPTSSRHRRPRYLGPLIVISRNRGGAYILTELDGSVFDRPTAAFRVIPYSARRKIDLPPLDNLLDISRQRLTELENTDNTELDDNSPDDTDFLLDD